MAIESDNVTLKDNDVIRIPTYKTRIDVEGYVKQPGYFEVLDSETFKDLLKYAPVLQTVLIALLSG